jgi:homoserine dehydrogenase
MQVKDQPGVLADVTRILGDKGISIEAIIQKEPKDDSAEANVIMLTHRVVEKQMNKAIKQIEALKTITGEVTRIRLETLDSK